ncbi:MAG: T9SS type A sorting domain-containing protein [Bacteroidales bacterium]|nr:T9SS type A sorting domain-containing protein [Bacteroidales bacterium]
MCQSRTNINAQIPQYGKFEIPVYQNALPQALKINGENAYNPEEIVLKATFTGLGGTVDINGFYFEEYTLSDGSYSSTVTPMFPYINPQIATPTNNNFWKVRFTPTVQGSWTYQLKFYFPQSDEEVNAGSGSFTCVSPSANNNGFLSFNSDNELLFSNGEGFIPLGLNVANWPETSSQDLGSNFFQPYFERMNENGANFIRLFIDCTDALMLIGRDSCSLHFDYLNGKRAKQIDEIVRLAEENGIYLQFCISMSRNFYDEGATLDQWRWIFRNTYNENMNPEWCASSYTEGIIDSGEKFFYDMKAKEKHKSVLKYIVDRWGYSPNVFAYEFFNEVNSSIGDESKIADWHVEMNNYIKSIDKYGRLTTTSMLGNDIDSNRQVIFSNMNYSSPHRYINQWDDRVHLSYGVWKNIVDDFKLKNGNTPVQIGETMSLELLGNKNIGFEGVSHDKILEEYDPNSFTFHSDVWSSLFIGSFSTAVYWTWPAFIERNELSNPASKHMQQFKAVSKFTKDLPPIGSKNQVSTIIDPASNKNIHGAYVKDNSRNMLFGWVQDKNFSINSLITCFDKTSQSCSGRYGSLADYCYSLSAADRPSRASSNNTFSVALPSAGKFIVKWYNTETGNVVVKENINASSTSFNLTIPTLLLQSTYGDAAFIISTDNSGWSDDYVTNTGNKVLLNTKIEYSNNQLFYVRDDGIIHAIYEQNNDNWIDTWLTSAAPTMKSGSESSVGFDVVTENNNEIFFAAYNQTIRRLYWNGSGWSNVETNASAKVRPDSELHYGNGQVMYVRPDGILSALYKSGSSWTYTWLNGSAPRVKPGSGFALIPEQNNTIFYIAENNRIYHMYYSSGWKCDPTNSSALARSDSKLYYGNGQIFYVRPDGYLCALYKNGTTWVYDWLNGSAPKVKAGTGFVVLPEQNNTIYYTDVDDNIVKMYYDWNVGWAFEKIYISQSVSGGAKENHNLAYTPNNIFYVGDQDSRVHRLQYTYEVPFSVLGTTIGQVNNWDLPGADGTDVSYKFLVNDQTTIYATTSAPQTTIAYSKIAIYNQNKSLLYYKYIGSPASGNALTATLNAGIYYIVVDGYAPGNFKLIVNDNSMLKSAGNYDNESEVLDIEAINADEKDIDLLAFPNPVTTNLNIVLPTDGDYRIDIIDINGRTIRSINTKEQQITIDCTAITNGVYLIRAIGSGAINQKKIVINR